MAATVKCRKSPRHHSAQAALASQPNHEHRQQNRSSPLRRAARPRTPLWWEADPGSHLSGLPRSPVRRDRRQSDSGAAGRIRLRRPGASRTTAFMRSHHDGTFRHLRSGNRFISLLGSSFRLSEPVPPEKRTIVVTGGKSDVSDAQGSKRHPASAPQARGAFRLLRGGKSREQSMIYETNSRVVHPRVGLDAATGHGTRL